MKKIQMKSILFFALLFIGMLFGNADVKAAGGTITLSAGTGQPVVGDTFTVVCEVSVPGTFKDVDCYLGYDAKIMEFVKGGSKVSGDNGVLHIASVENEAAVTKRTFSLQFKAIKKGAAIISVTDSASIVDASNNPISVSSNQLSLNIVKPGEVAANSEEAEDTRSKNTKLTSLKTSGIKIKPEFSPEVREYTVTVDYQADILYLSYQCGHPKAVPLVTGNEGLKEGINVVKIEVTAESGRKKAYTLNVKKESKSETMARKKKEEEKAGESGVSFFASEKKGVITLHNEYQFSVLPVENETVIPSGYVKSKIQIDGIDVPAYTMANDLENNYLLLYLQGPSGEPAVYQYDRQEKTLQRYTGGMIEKINREGQNGYVTQEENSSGDNTVYIVIIAVLIIIILGILMAMLDLVLKNKKRLARSD